MTIASTATSVQYLRNGTTTQWSYPNKIFAAADLTVIDLDTSVPPVVVTLALGADYTVSNVDVDTGCIVTTTGGGIAGHTLDIRSNISALQATSIKNQGSYLPELHEEFFDRITRELQDLRRLAYTFGIHGPDTESAVWAALPNATARANTGLIFDSLGQPNVGFIPTTVFTQTIFNSFLGSSPPYATTGAEAAAGVAIVNAVYPPGNVLRYGLVPNSVGAAGSNTTILKALLAYSTTGPTGLIWFPNTTGADVYTFGATPITVRQFIRLDLGGCTLSVTGASAGVDVNTGFLYALSDVIIENGTITTAVDTTLGVNAAACIWVGARGAGFYYTVYDSTQGAGKSLGRVILRNLTLSNNNTVGKNSAPPLGLLGGISNLLVENVTISCNSVTNASGAPGGIYYEWGWATNPSGTATSQCSNGHNMRFSNIRVTNCAGVALGLTGCYNAVIDGLFTNNCVQDFVYSIGEAMFYLPWVGVDQFGAKRNIHLLNLVGQGTTGTAVQLNGANVGSGTFYGTAGVTFTPAQQTDLMTFTLDNVAARTLVVGGPIVARNCKFDSGSAFVNPVTINDDCIFAEFTDCIAIGGTGAGMRANIAGTGVWSPVRQKYIRWNGGLIAGNVGAGAQLANTRAARFTDVRIGYSTLYDAAAESVQTLGVSAGTGANGVICDSCYVTTSGGVAYSITGTTSSGCNLVNPQGTITTTGAWEFDGMAVATNVQVIDKTALINTVNKRFGRRVWNTNGYLMIAQGPAVTDTWVMCGFGTTSLVLTPS